MTTLTIVQSVQPTKRTRLSPSPAFVLVAEFTASRSTTGNEKHSPHQALLVNQNYQYEFSDVSRSALDPHEISICTKAIGLNPIDWKTVDYKFCMLSLPWINGRECSGVIEAVGTAVKSFRIGQRVWTSTYYRYRRAGCFQELVVAPEHTVLEIPECLSFEKAACLGVTGLTAAMTLWKWFDLPVISSGVHDQQFALIWGGSTSTGQFAVQIAAEAGLKVIAVASQRMKQKLLEFGAHYVIVRDSRSLEDIATEVQKIGGDDILYGIDLVGPHSSVHGIDCLSRQRPAKFAPLAVPAPPIDAPKNVEIVNVEMKRFVLDQMSRKYANRLTELMAKGRVQVPEHTILTGGLAAVEDGLSRLRSSETGGRKLVVRM